DNKSDTKLFSHMTVKVMAPEQLFDSLAMVTGLGRGGALAGKGPKGPKGGPVGARAQFVAFFLSGADGTSPVDYEAGIPQALRLRNSPIANNPGAVRMVLGGIAKPDEAFEKIYLAVLARHPTAEEKKTLTAYTGRIGNANTAYSDILWATLNSSEFTLIR